MDLVSSSVFEVADLLRGQLQANLFNGQDARVTIGGPGLAKAEVSEDKPVLNLFFYKIQPPGFFPDTGAHETWRVRLHCLVTAFAESNTAGEDELKLIGQVLRYFHENPILNGIGVNTARDYALQIVFLPLTSEEINQLWATFGDVDFRPSLTYEIALVPVDPLVKAQPAPPVASGGATARADLLEPEKSFPPPPGLDPVEIGTLEVNTGATDWAPAIAFIEGDKILPSLTVSFGDFSGVEEGILARLWVAGLPETKIDLVLKSRFSGSWKDLDPPLYSKELIPEQETPGNQTRLSPKATAITPINMTRARFDLAVMKIKAADPSRPTASTQFLVYARRKISENEFVYSNPLILNISGSEHDDGGTA